MLHIPNYKRLYLITNIPNYNVQNLCLLQTLQQEFKMSLSEMAAGMSKEESEPQAGTSTDPSALLPPRVL